MTKRKIAWEHYLFEFLIVFVGVTLAFSLSKWNEGRKEARSEIRILIEIRNGLERDLDDININIQGHNAGIAACDYFRQIINGQPADSGSIQSKFHVLLRDYVTIQNQSGYESLKSKGLELIRDDSLRLSIISTYEFEYEAIRKLEEEYAENQFHQNYFAIMNDLLSGNFIFDSNGYPVDMELPLKLTDKEKKKLLTILWKIETNRNFSLKYYSQLQEEVSKLIQEIDREIETLTS